MVHSLAHTLDIRLTAPLRAKPEDVYRALTSARELCVWLLARAETDARNTGRFRMVWPKSGRGEDFETVGMFVDLEPGQKVAWIWDAVKRPRGVPPLVTFFIEKQLRGSQVTLIHAGFSAAPSRGGVIARYTQRWEDCLAKLKLYLDSGKTCKGDPLTMADVQLLRKGGRKCRSKLRLV